MCRFEGRDACGGVRRRRLDRRHGKDRRLGKGDRAC